ncbi:MAG: CAP domain-containing protein [Candidatus Spechtbacterales bacterium]
MKKHKILFALAVVVFASSILLLGPFQGWWPGVNESVRNFFAEEIQRQIFAPDPLRGPEEGQGSLTRSGVIEWTNTQRTQFGLPALRENSKLNEAAALKVADMFENQYFAHISPSGKGVGELAEEVRYSFILIGENLALGNFASDALLVDAWMASPGHRENILKREFTEIGVAVKRGEFEGRQIWLAVQHFAKPLSDCPQPDESLKSQISANNAQLEAWKIELEEKKQDLENTHPKAGPIYKSKVDEYNELVEKYNNLSRENAARITEYNNQVNTFNACAKN